MDIKKFVLLIVITFQVGIVFGTVPCGNAKIEYHLNRANSLHWLSRLRENSVFEANCSKKHVDSAYHILTESGMESACKIEYTKQINSFYTELDELIGVSLDNLNGKYPLVPFITKQYNQFEYYDDICVFRCANSTFQSMSVEACAGRVAKPSVRSTLFCRSVSASIFTALLCP